MKAPRQLGRHNGKGAEPSARSPVTGPAARGVVRHRREPALTCRPAGSDRRPRQALRAQHAELAPCNDTRVRRAGPPRGLQLHASPLAPPTPLTLRRPTGAVLGLGLPLRRLRQAGALSPPLQLGGVRRSPLVAVPHHAAGASDNHRFPLSPALPCRRLARSLPGTEAAASVRRGRPRQPHFPQRPRRFLRAEGRPLGSAAAMLRAARLRARRRLHVVRGSPRRAPFGHRNLGLSFFFIFFLYMLCVIEHGGCVREALITPLRQPPVSTHFTIKYFNAIPAHCKHSGFA